MTTAANVQRKHVDRIRTPQPKARQQLYRANVVVTAAFLVAFAPLRPVAATLSGFELGPGGTVVRVRLTERVSSQDAQTGQHVRFETTAPVTIDGIAVPAGTAADGVVAFVRPGRGPRPGALRLAASALHLVDGTTIAVGLEPNEAGTVSAAEVAHPAGLAFPTAAGTVVIGGLTRGSNVVYERGARFTLLAPPPPSPEPEPT